MANINDDYSDTYLQVQSEAENGDVDSLYYLAKMLFIAGGLDNKNALDYMEQAAGYGHLEALKWLSLYYERKKKPSLTYKYTELAAECGDVESQIRMAYFLLTGLFEQDEFGSFIIDKDVDANEAAKWLLTAAKGGNSDAKKYLSMLLDQGLNDYYKQREVASRIYISYFGGALLDSGMIYVTNEGFKYVDKTDPNITLDDILNEERSEPKTETENNIDIEELSDQLDELNEENKQEIINNDDFDEDIATEVVIDSSIIRKKPKKLHRSGLDLSSWNAQKLTDIKLTFYLKDANITLSYGNYSVTKPADMLFSAKSLKLLKMAYDFFTQGLPKIRYHDKTLHTGKGTELENHRIVTYFNSDFRKIFGMSIKEKAFDWDGSKHNRILVKNFELEVRR